MTFCVCLTYVREWLEVFQIFACLSGRFLSIFFFFLSPLHSWLPNRVVVFTVWFFSLYAVCEMLLLLLLLLLMMMMVVVAAVMLLFSFAFPLTTVCYFFFSVVVVVLSNEYRENLSKLKMCDCGGRPLDWSSLPIMYVHAIHFIKHHHDSCVFLVKL